ncbi:hypothetical protein J4E83_002403 [Alternaria metachromatica]|uniref:uncharacterized protein n=1 Tax=Alternaria metachromatica TaxID=283354 RepID=UPI0020C50818|nr:uncharacterized protein J4E83_002403 [Alternaria metachromatica]KAI4630879.1 hypothetical protein J4E83_002403 [Alternaria metachromatica]
MAADDSNKAKTKCVTPDINKEYGHPDGNTGNDVQVKDNGQAGDGDEGNGEQSDDVDMDSHDTDSYGAYMKKSKELKSQMRMHFSNGNMAQFDRVQREFREHDLLGEVEAELLDLDTAAALIALSRSSTDYQHVHRRHAAQVLPQSSTQVLPQLSAQPFYAHLFPWNNAAGGRLTSGPTSTTATHQVASATQHGSTALSVAVQLAVPVPPAPVLAVPQASPPTTLNLLPTLPLDAYSDNDSLGKSGGGKGLDGKNEALYRTAPPPNLDYTLLDFEITLLEMAALWARDLDNDPDLGKKVESLRCTMQHQGAKPTDADPTSVDKSAAFWDHEKKFFTKASPTLEADVSLLRLSHGVVRHPQGQHRGRLTIAIEHATLYGHQDVMLSQVEQYIQVFNLNVPGPLAAGADLAAVNDFLITWALRHPPT